MMISLCLGSLGQKLVGKSLRELVSTPNWKKKQIVVLLSRDENRKSEAQTTESLHTIERIERIERDTALRWVHRSKATPLQKLKMKCEGKGRHLHEFLTSSRNLPNKTGNLSFLRIKDCGRRKTGERYIILSRRGGGLSK